METRVSVVIPSYNRAPLLEEALDSVLKQTCPVFEILVVDDGSTDDTHDLVRSYGGNVKLIIQSHAGVSAARNRGIASACGEWIALLDSDDRWRPEKIAAQVDYLRLHPDCDLVHTAYSHFGKETRPIPPSPYFVRGEYKVEYFLSEYWICPSSALLRKSSIGRFPEWTSFSEDVLFFADFFHKGGRPGYIDSRLVDYRIHEVSLTKNPMCEAWGASAQLRWIDETFSTDTVARNQLRQTVVDCSLRQMEMLKYRRDWPRYWALRNWVGENWGQVRPQPPALAERIFPPTLYKIKDWVDSLIKSTPGS